LKVGLKMNFGGMDHASTFALIEVRNVQNRGKMVSRTISKRMTF
jgi:hypothetical protein